MTIDVDLFKKRTEYESQQAWDKFWLAFGPKWFTWLGWVLILGAFQFVAVKVDNFSLRAVNGLSFMVLLCYFQCFFYQFKFINLPLTKDRPKVARLVSLLISAVLALGVMILLNRSVEVLMATKS